MKRRGDRGGPLIEMEGQNEQTNDDLISKLKFVFARKNVCLPPSHKPASRCINAWMHSLKKSVKPEIVNRYDLWVLRHKIGGAKVFVNNVQWSDQMM
jgi:hypothetical protein